MDCTGRWGFHRELGETGITVANCTGCGERWAFEGSRSAGTFPPGTSDRQIIDARIAARFRTEED
jgi:hypothetical protein